MGRKGRDGERESCQNRKKKKKAIKTKQTGLSWWGEEFPCQCRRQGFDIWSEKILQVLEQPSPYTTTIEPRPRESQQEEPLQCVAGATQVERSPHSKKVGTTEEKVCAATKI